MRQHLKRKTKIVATIGPASSSRETINQLIEAGIDVARLNFSHGDHQQHLSALKLIREEAQKLGRHVGVFQDLSGPKLRISAVKNDQIELIDDSNVELKHGDSTGTAKALYVASFDPPKVMAEGEKVLLADGRIELIVERITPKAAVCKVVAGGALRSRSGISVPDSNLKLDCLTDKDKVDLAWAIENNVDFVALSFLGSARDVHDLNVLMDSMGKRIPVIAKIERASSLDHISEIVEVADAVMVARGDLGLELPIERVPSAQRLIIGTANHTGTPVITATQMLMSMVSEIRPTRAEVTDVSTAVRDGTDAVMLSEETAIGEHPVEAVKVLTRIVEQAEQEQNLERVRPSIRSRDDSKVADAICFAACNAAEKISASAMIACTQSGYTAKLMAKYRPQEPLFGATMKQESLARMSLYWGVHPLLLKIDNYSSIEDEIIAAMESVRDQYGIKPGSRAVITAGLRANTPGATNVMEIRDIPRAI